MTLTYGSVCSGIEATTQAWHQLGMVPKFFAETDEFCAAVLAHHWPEVPNLGDFTQIGKSGPAPAVDVLIGGTPCQSFSQAGGRAGLRDPRGNLALEFLLLAARLKVKWVVWENVPGVLFSSGADGREDEDDSEDPPGPDRNTNWMDFGTILGALGELGFGFCYRILDAAHFGVPQRRRRVFIVGRAGGDWRAPAAVLLERESMRGLAPPRRTPGPLVAHAAQASSGGRDREDKDVALTAKSRLDVNNENLVVATLTSRPYSDHGGQGNQLIYNVQPVSASVEKNTLVAKPTQVAEALTSMGPQRRCDRGDVIVMPLQGNAYCRDDPTSGFGLGEEGDPSYTLKGDNDASVVVTQRVTPIQDTVNVEKQQNGIGIGEPGDPSYTLTSEAQGVCVEDRKAIPLQDVNAGKRDGSGIGIGEDGDPSYALLTRRDMGVFTQEPITFDPAQVTCPHDRSRCEPGDPAPTLSRTGRPSLAYRSVVRRLTPREYERLQGMADDFTLIRWKGKPAPDGRRYKAVGNSMAVPVMKWIGRRILMVDEILAELGDQRDAKGKP